MLRERAPHDRRPYGFPCDRIFSGKQKTMHFWRLRRQTAFGLDGKQRIKDEDQDLRQNASQRSINRQINPLIQEEKLFELPGPPLCVSEIATQLMDLIAG